ncbi:hypothetical protein BDP27DRAFT_1419056 [Rhodocollybia butyracea]|uniref:Uncharacterized protein n=1 Tax=Rhodocollybia butyracea TaxID=206335 RepID=A0A9P5U8Z3_9AGAR|nr:hypothetical protein BDP27DRAFT_1419056 [Rhodocollybia butyracea]
MFFTHHLLAFALLAVLISPACAAPAPPEKRSTKYTVEVPNSSQSANEEIKGSTQAIAPELGLGASALMWQDFEPKPHGDAVKKGGAGKRP